MGRARSMLGCVAIAACSFHAHDADRDGATHGDARARDGRDDGSSGGSGELCADIDGLALHVCLASAPTGSATLGDLVVDTGGTASCAPLAADSDPACVLAATTLVVPAGVAIAGSGALPLVLLATTELDIAGAIDVASHRGGNRGPMANPSTGCDAGVPPSGVSSGGGAGGSYGTAGGAGGTGSPPDSGGSAASTVALALHGGCPGQAGTSTGDPTTPGGDGGAGGGLVVLVAPTIAFAPSAVIDASGEGGGGAPSGNTRGGGGGGAGGVIILDGTVASQAGAQVFANGGGGGGGTSTPPGAGAGGDPATAIGAPAGGTAEGEAGSGGTGAFTPATGTLQPAKPGGPATNPTDGGGGGGGGAGIIHVRSLAALTGSGAFSPPPSH